VADVEGFSSGYWVSGPVVSNTKMRLKELLCEGVTRDRV
jgi:hypothetical protein